MAHVGRPILIVEDHVSVAHALARLLRNAARRPVLVEHTASTAVATLGDRDDWCGLVLDVGLGASSEPTGLDVLSFARARFQTLPIMMLTARLEHDIVNAAARQQASYVCKPAGLAELRPFIELVLSTEAFPDQRIASAVTDTLLRADLHATRCADVLRLAVAGLDPDQIRERLELSVGAYDANVQRLLRRTGARDLKSLVNTVVRAAVRAPGKSVPPPQ